MNMTELERITFLRKYKDDLLEKLNHRSTTYTESVQITDMMRNVNLEIQSLKGVIDAQDDAI